jgi:hypothetical protein
MPSNSPNISINLPCPGWRCALLHALQEAIRSALRSAVRAVLRSTAPPDRLPTLQRRSVLRSIVRRALGSVRYRSALRSLLHVPTNVPSSNDSTDVGPTTIPYYLFYHYQRMALQSAIDIEIYSVQRALNLRDIEVQSATTPN